MATIGLIDMLSQMLIKILPSPTLWGLGILLLIVLYMVLKRFPSSSSLPLGVALVLNLSLLLGGIFVLLYTVLVAIAGAYFLLGLWQFIGRR